MKRISVIVPVYNNPKAVRLTVNSILSSDFPLDQVEGLVCDDGSSEDMKAVVREYENEIAICYFWQEDKGFWAARFEI